MAERDIPSPSLELAVADERAAYLKRARGGDANLRQQVEQLLTEREKPTATCLGLTLVAGRAADSPAEIAEKLGAPIRRSSPRSRFPKPDASGSETAGGRRPVTIISSLRQSARKRT